MQSKEEIERLLTSFPAYLAYIYSCINLPKPTGAQDRIATILGENRERLILEAFRGVGKTWITAAYATWRLLRNKNEKILIVSASGTKADEISQFTRRLFDEAPLLYHLRPNKRNGNRDSVVGFDVSGCSVAVSPSVKSIGITGQLTGSRGSLIILDDVEVLNNSMTEGMRAKLIQSVREVEALLIPDMPSSVVMLGTPQSIESIYNKLDYPVSVIPAQVPEDPMLYEGKLDDWVLTRGVAGDAVDPERFPLEVLMQRKAGYGNSGYNLQFMLDTTLSDANRFPLKLKDLVVMNTEIEECPLSVTYTGDSRNTITELANLGFTGDRYQSALRINERYAEYDLKVMAIDPSGTGADETTWAIIGVKNGLVYVLDVGGHHLAYSTEGMTLLAYKAQEYNVNEIVVEKNYGDGMWSSMFEPVLVSIFPRTVYDYQSRGQKEVRIIDTLEPITSNHKMVWSRDLIEREIQEGMADPKDLIRTTLYQYTHITRDRQSLVHDDRVDVLAIACDHIKHLVVVDPELMAARFKEEQKQTILDEYFAKTLAQYGNNGNTNSFISKFKR